MNEQALINNLQMRLVQDFVVSLANQQLEINLKYIQYQISYFIGTVIKTLEQFRIHLIQLLQTQLGRMSFVQYLQDLARIYSGLFVFVIQCCKHLFVYCVDCGLVKLKYEKQYLRRSPIIIQLEINERFKVR